MRDVLVHRGPDDQGLYLDSSVGLGHRRLSIVDLSGGHQPMLNDDGSICIVYNGEVYNHPALRASLEARGQQFRTRCDTETVLRLYERYGASLTQHLRGMFAFAIWDRNRRELLLARDRFGVKPLYYFVASDGSLYFASEIKSLLASNAVHASLDLSAFPDYLANHATSGTQTLFDGVKRLAPGSILRWHDGSARLDQYWDHSFDPVDHTARTDRALVAEFRERFREAVRIRLMADVPLGTFLSGGIDSAAITAEMSTMVDAPVRTFSVAFAEREANELTYARLVAKQFRTEHHEIVVTPEEFFASLPRMIWHEDEPLAHPSSVPLHFVSRLAAQHVKVVLTGEGSDEMLAGYGRYRTTMYNVALGERYQRLVPRILREIVRVIIEHMSRTVGIARKLTRTSLCLPADVVSLYFDNFAVFSRSWQRELLHASTRERIGHVNPYVEQLSRLGCTDARSLLDSLLYVDVKTYLHELLMKQDQMSMAASIESRVPFLDHPLAEFTAGLPQRLKLRRWTTKRVLREAMRGVLPDEILRRPKMGFPVPVGRWLRGPFRWMVDEYVLSERAKARGLFDPAALRRLVDAHQHGENHAERLWSLLNLEIWQRIFLDGESPEDVGRRTRLERQWSASAAVPEQAEPVYQRKV